MAVRISSKQYKALISKQDHSINLGGAKASHPALIAFEKQFYSEPEMALIRETPHSAALQYLQKHPEKLSGSMESYEQTFVMHFFECNHPDVYNYMLAVPNAGKRTKRERGHLLAEGLKKGVPDLFVEKAVGNYHGLRIELKKSLGRKGDVSEAQWGWLKKYDDEGFKACVAIGYRECIALICAYVEVKCRFKNINSECW